MEVDRTHEKAAVETLAFIKARDRVEVVRAYASVALAHAVLDLAQAIREGHDAS